MGKGLLFVFVAPKRRLSSLHDKKKTCSLPQRLYSLISQYHIPSDLLACFNSKLFDRELSFTWKL